MAPIVEFGVGFTASFWVTWLLLRWYDGNTVRFVKKEKKLPSDSFWGAFEEAFGSKK